MIDKDFKERYNKILAREEKGRMYLDNPNISIGKREKWFDEYNSICRQLSIMMDAYKSVVGKEMTTEEVLEGFKTI